MKKNLILLLLIVFLVPFMVMAGGGKEEESTEKVVVKNPNQPDPWILEMRAEEKPFAQGKVKFTGTEGEIPQYDTDFLLTNAEVAEIRAMKLKAVYVDNNTAGEYSLALIGGTRDTLEYLGIELVAETSADFDPQKQKSDVETVMAMKPDLVIGYAVDPTTGTEVFRPVVDKGIPLVLVSNRPKGYNPGKEYVGISTNNPWDNGYVAGEMLAKAMVKIDPNAEVGLLLYEDEYFVLNVMDDAVQEAIKKHGPNLKVRIEGYVDWQMAGEKATALVQKYPGIKGMYSTWFDPAMVAVSDLKAIDRGDIQMFTFGMNTPALLDLLDPDGMVKGLSTDFTWNVGMNTAILGAYGILGKKAPELLVVPSVTVTADNLRQIWNNVYRGVDLPKEVDDALKKLGK